MRNTLRLFFLFTVLLFPFSGFSQKELVCLVHIASSKGTYLHNIYPVSNEKMLIQGSFLGEIVLGPDTLSAGYWGNSFLTWFEGGSMNSSMSFTGRILEVDKGAFGVEDGVNLSRYDFKNRKVWTYKLTQKDSVRRSVLVTDMCFDDMGNTYVLFQIYGEAELQFKSQVIKGPGNIIVKIDAKGHPSSFRKIADEHIYSRLKSQSNKICAFGTYSSVVMDRQLKEIAGDDLNALCRFSLWDSGNYFRIEMTGKRPLMSFVLEKYNPKEGIVRKEVFRDTARIQHGIELHRLLDMNGENLMVVYTRKEANSDNNKHPMQMHFLVITKKSLEIVRDIVLHCDGLYPLSTSNGMVFQFLGNDLLIASEYMSQCKIGNLSFEGPGKKSGWRSFFIVKQPLD